MDSQFYFRDAVNPVARTPTVLQMEALECGAAALAMVLGYFGKSVPLEQLRIDCGVSTAGTNAANIVKAARKHGLECRGFRRELGDLKEQTFPAVIFWNFNHFVVLEGIRRNKVYINDPADGKKVLSWEDFDVAFTGIVLQFEKTGDFVRQKNRKTVLLAIKNHLAGTRDVLLYIGIMDFLLFLNGIISPVFTRFFTDQILVEKMTGYFKPLLSAMALSMIVTGVLSWFHSLAELKFGTKIAVKEASGFLTHILRLPVEFFTQRIPGELCRRIDTAESVAQFLSRNTVSLVIKMFSLVFYAVLMSLYDITLTVISILSVGICVMVYCLTKDKFKTGTLKELQELSKMGGQVMTGITMIETLKACGSENDFFDKFSGQEAKYALETQKVSRLSLVTGLVPALSSQILRIVLLVAGSYKIINGTLTIGMLMAFQVLQGSFMGIVNEFFQLAQTFHTTNAGIKRIDDVMDYPVSRKFKDDFEAGDGLPPADFSADAPKFSGRVELRNVSFGYTRTQPPLIENLNLTMSPGSRIALVGSSGSGKSTIGKLVASLYEPWDGEILFDGRRLSEITRAEYSASVAAVDQDIFLFDGTVKDNLTMWDESIREEDYIQAAKDACIHDIISARPGGYFSPVLEMGENFSGGQRQRLEIARALCRNPNILILDEATSALDAVTEMQIDRNLRRRGCSCIIIAHRLSTIRDSDEIIVLDKGKIAERGTHDRLIQNNGPYSRLVKIM